MSHSLAVALLKKEKKRKRKRRKGKREKQKEKREEKREKNLHVGEIPDLALCLPAILPDQTVRAVAARHLCERTAGVIVALVVGDWDGVSLLDGMQDGSRHTCGCRHSGEQRGDAENL